MTANTEPEYEIVEASVVVIADDTGRVLLDFNDRWGGFTLPVSKRRPVSPRLPGGPTERETPLAAAVRAAAEVIGRPIDPAGLMESDAVVPPWHQSGRDGKWKRYDYTVFAFRFSGDPRPVPGHMAVRLTRSEIDTLAPISPTVGLVLNAMPG